MFVVTNREMREIDRYTIEQIGIPSAVLMENAGRSVVNWITEHIRKDMRVGVVCGKGNNGGDGIVIARYLHNMGYSVQVHLLENAQDLSRDCAQQYTIARNMGLPIECLKEEGLENTLGVYDCMIDALLGTGSKGNLQGLYKDAVDTINEIKRAKNHLVVVSIDCPTGVIGDDGQVSDAVVQADYTIVLGFTKQGLYQYPAAGYAGNIVVVDIGIPKKVEEEYPIKRQLITEQLIEPWIPHRTANSHKGTYGRVRCIAGSADYMGAGLLAATASLHIGAGLVYWDAPEELRRYFNGQTPELIFRGYASEGGTFSPDSADALVDAANDAKAVVVGCGVDDFTGSLHWMEKLVTGITCPLIIDASAFVMLKKQLDILLTRKGVTVVTPHPGEIAKVLKISVAQLESKRIYYAEQFAKRYHVTIILKGAHTIIATPEGNTYINTTGSHVLAKAGTGDVLAGFIGGLAAQGVSLEMAACVAVYIHGKAAEQLAETTYVSTMASDVSRTAGAILHKIAHRA
ncbi:hypothetical protein BHU72_06990 [Desulfuribacillus stibiiarsenatis]|uniref:Bifunctional NAD(P)H-hydrate repair enzyme n=1 Tax=Desulfuribacillus stibiiarsenatis TaxID=1390249 RepID=A0A1E5L4B4_9FIRM|nr:bifunctional ADP-dependent NAD(P)H-hydrate dehydratase/NAD(P)H-hydrate epimerase [Desulfuribacillus stibiiarsenatis]OEH84931.1 hypothetical protein BHU72_06990 [Desulfuribacillus stibiiarsenatis]